MKLNFTTRAANDLKRLRQFIAKRNPAAAKRVSQHLETSINHLKKNPKLGKPLAEILGVQELIASSYVVRYLVKKMKLLY